MLIIFFFVTNRKSSKTVFLIKRFSFLEKKRRVYDQYGKDGLLGHNERTHRSRRHEDEYDPFGGFSFSFRDPEDVFREFFGGSGFGDLFGKTFFLFNRINLTFICVSGEISPAYNRRQHRHSHPQNNTITTQFMSPFMGFSMMDDFFQGNGRTGYSSFQSINASSHLGNGGGAVKRTSTSTTFSNGKKITTKRYLSQLYV